MRNNARRRAGARDQPRGFTLLEVMVALAVVAIALAAAIKAAAQFSSNSAYLRDRSFAHWVAMNQAASLQVNRAWPEPGETTGLESMGQRQWRWRVRIESTPDPAVRRIVVDAGADTPGAAPLATLVAYLGQGARSADAP